MGLAQVPSCTQLSVPEDGDTDVSTAIDFEWNPSEGATEYIVIAGTTFGGTDILNNVGVGNVTEYNLPADLPPSQTIYVAIVPINGEGANGNCTQISFVTAASDGLPECTDATSPEHAAQNISLAPELTWMPVSDADGYLLTIGTTSGEPPLLNRFDVGDITAYNAPTLEQNTTYYFSVIPYNGIGVAENCGVQSSFTTGGTATDPLSCAQLLFPEDNSENIPTSVELEWQEVDEADGYLLSVGTNSATADILDAFDVGNTNYFQLPEELPSATKIYVSVTPYLEGSITAGCRLFSFTTNDPDLEMNDSLVPQFFTPNNDGVNDSWSVPSNGNITVLKVLIFDRYGKLLVQLSPDQEWDGSLNGRNFPSGSYWYSIQLANAKDLRGFFLLKR